EEEECRQACPVPAELETSEEPPAVGRRVVQPPGAGGKPEELLNSTSSYEEYCMAPQVTGPCRAAFPRWYHDPVTPAWKPEDRPNATSSYEGRWPPGASGDLDEGSIHSTRAVALAVLLALMAAVLLGSVVVFFAKLCRKGPECAAGHGWSPLDDKEHLMTSSYVL
ncbi:putative Kunitz-type serine protease inhibitor, partial [Alligator sinensis]|uniref:Kunitz-type serine protease inhibitor n=1 Tax=Alligator sinensis TaxID=38654 RepID=A0A1U8DCP6_ALLSI